MLENDQIKVTICPDLGGKVTDLIYKKSGKEVSYVPDVIKQACAHRMRELNCVEEK